MKINKSYHQNNNDIKNHSNNSQLSVNYHNMNSNLSFSSRIYNFNNLPEPRNATKGTVHFK